MKKLAVIFALLICYRAHGQTSAVTATVTDPDGQTWNNGKFTINFIPTPGVPGPYTWNGGQTFTQQFQGSMSAGGVIAISLPSSNFITPSGSQWQFTLCSNTSAPCQNVTTAVTGAAPNLSTVLSLPLIAPRFSAGQFAFGYLDVEVVGPNNGALVPGVQYWNVTTAVSRQWTGTIWQNLSGGGGGGGNVTTTPGPGVSQIINQQAGTNFAANILGGVDWDIGSTSPYNWSQSIASTLTGSVQAIVNLAPCPVGIDTSNFANALYTIGINGGVEYVAVTGGSCVSGFLPGGTVIFTPQNSYGNPFTLGSANTGLQETINDECRGSTNYTVSDGGNCEVWLSPARNHSTPNYVIGSVSAASGVSATVYVQARNIRNIAVHGNGAFIQSCDRSRGIFLGNLATNSVYVTLEDVNMTGCLNIPGVGILDVAAAGGSPSSTITVHTSAAHTFRVGDYVRSEYYTHARVNNIFAQVTAVPDNTHYQYLEPSNFTFAASSGFGRAVLEMSLIHSNTNGGKYSNIHFDGIAGTFWHHGLVIDDDEAADIDHVANTGHTGRCDSTWCAPVIASGIGSGVLYVHDSELSEQCTGNGIDYRQGNSIHLSNTVIQGFNQFGFLFTGTPQPNMVTNNYQEASIGCTNPYYPTPIASAAGGIVGGNTTIEGDAPITGQYPRFVTGGGSGTRINYFVVPIDGAAEKGPVLAIGDAEPANGGVSIPVAWPAVTPRNTGGDVGTVTYDLLATTGTTVTPLFGTGTWAVSTGIACTPTPNGFCTFSDTQAARSSYTIAAQNFDPLLWYWPGTIISNNSKVAMTTVGFSNNYIASTGIKKALFQGLGCSTAGSNWPALYSPVFISCGHGDPLSGTGSFAHSHQANDEAGNSGPINSKGLEIYQQQAAQRGIITLQDSNHAKTAATPGSRPVADAGDVALVGDGAGQLAIAVGTALHTYVNTVPDGASFVENLTASAKTMTIPLTAPSFTASNANGGFSGTEGTGAAVPAGAGLDTLWPDSTAHRWKMNNNNTGAVTVASLSDTTIAGVGGVGISGVPIAGQVPIATSGTTATWQSPSAFGVQAYDVTWSHTSGASNVNTSITLAQADLVANAEWVMQANVAVADAGGASPALATQFTLGGTNVTGCTAQSTGAANNGATVAHAYRIRIKVLTTGVSGTAKVQCNMIQTGGALDSKDVGPNNTTDATTTINTTGSVALTWTCSDSNGTATCHYYDSYTLKLK